MVRQPILDLLAVTPVGSHHALERVTEQSIAQGRRLVIDMYYSLHEFEEAISIAQDKYQVFDHYVKPASERAAQCGLAGTKLVYVMFYDKESCNSGYFFLPCFDSIRVGDAINKLFYLAFHLYGKDAGDRLDWLHGRGYDLHSYKPSDLLYFLGRLDTIMDMLTSCIIDSRHTSFSNYRKYFTYGD
jgi:hypothetical protein